MAGPLRTALAMLLGTPLAAALAQQSGGDAESQFQAALQAVVPSPEERAFEGVPWRTELRQALVEGDAQDRPVLLWAMNGHPLGLT